MAITEAQNHIAYTLSKNRHAKARWRGSFSLYNRESPLAPYQRPISDLDTDCPTLEEARLTMLGDEKLLGQLGFNVQRTLDDGFADTVFEEAETERCGYKALVSGNGLKEEVELNWDAMNLRRFPGHKKGVFGAQESLINVAVYKISRILSNPTAAETDFIDLLVMDHQQVSKDNPGGQGFPLAAVAVAATGLAGSKSYGDVISMLKSTSIYRDQYNQGRQRIEPDYMGAFLERLEPLTDGSICPSVAGSIFMNEDGQIILPSVEQKGPVKIVFPIINGTAISFPARSSSSRVRAEPAAFAQNGRT